MKSCSLLRCRGPAGVSQQPQPHSRSSAMSHQVTSILCPLLQTSYCICLSVSTVANHSNVIQGSLNLSLIILTQTACWACYPSWTPDWRVHTLPLGTEWVKGPFTGGVESDNGSSLALRKKMNRLNPQQQRGAGRSYGYLKLSSSCLTSTLCGGLHVAYMNISLRCHHEVLYEWTINTGESGLRFTAPCSNWT